MQVLSAAAAFAPLLACQEPVPSPLGASHSMDGILGIQPVPLSHYTPLTPLGKLDYNLRRSVDGGALYRTALSAGIDEGLDSPDPWPDSIDGYGIRYTSKMGHRLAKHVIMAGAEIALRQDPRHIPTQSTTIMGRTKEAILNTYRIYKDDGGVTFNYPRLIGAYGSAFVSRTWHPAGYNTAGDALVSGTITLGTDAAISVFYEFWPDIKRVVFRRK